MLPYDPGYRVKLRRCHLLREWRRFDFVEFFVFRYHRVIRKTKFFYALFEGVLKSDKIDSR